ncbi:hypothetical protein DXG01_008008 [Tephrocybe rancida]|nr:hypothetical protein DXG01_008008 [Tephrocybe rancida]
MDAFLNNLLRSFVPTPTENADDSDMPPLEPISAASGSFTAQDTAMGNADDMPELQPVSDSSDGGESDDEANEVLMQAVDDDNDDAWTDDSASSMPPLEPITRTNRRARVEDDEDEDRDRRHPSQRVSNPVDSRNAAATPPTFDPPGTAQLPGQAIADEGADAPPAQQPAAPNNGPRLPMISGFAVTIDINGQRMVRPLQGGIPFEGLPGGFTDFFGLLSSLAERETEDPERAKQLVDGLEEVPVGLIRRLEALNGKSADGEVEGTGAGDCSCAICWDRLLDGEGGFGAEAAGSDQPNAEAPAEAPADAPTTGEATTEPETPAANAPMTLSSDPTQPKIVSLPCAHIFHATCLIPWFSRPRQTTCPTCRFNIDPERLTARRRVPPMRQPAAPPTGATQAQQPAQNAELPLTPEENGGAIGNTAPSIETPTAPASLDGEAAGVNANANPPNANPTPAPPAPNPTHVHPPGAVLTIGFDIVIGPPPNFGGGAPFPFPFPGAGNANASGDPNTDADNGEHHDHDHDHDNWGPMDMGIDEFDEAGMMDLDEDGPAFDDFFAANMPAPGAPVHLFEPNLGAGVGPQQQQQQQGPQQQGPQQQGPQQQGPQQEGQPQPPIMPPWGPGMMAGTGRTMGEAIAALLSQAGAGAPGQNMGAQAGAPPAQNPGAQAPPPQTQPGQQQQQQPGQQVPLGPFNAANGAALQGFLTALFSSMLAQQQAARQNQNQDPNPNPAPAQAQPQGNGPAPQPLPQGVPAGANAQNSLPNLGALFGGAAPFIPFAMAAGPPPLMPQNPFLDLASDVATANANGATGGIPASPPPLVTQNPFLDLPSEAANANGVPGGIPTSPPPLVTQNPFFDLASNVAAANANGFPGGIPNVNTNANPTPASAPAPTATANGPGAHGLNLPFNPFANLFAGLPMPNLAGAVPGANPQAPGQPTNAQFPRLTRLPPVASPYYPAAPPPREKKAWTLPPAPGPTLRQRIERREREAGLRCFDISCGVGPSDEDPFARLTEAAKRQLNIRALRNKERGAGTGHEHELGDGQEGENVCPHTFHPSCLVSAARVALMGEEAEVVDGDIEIACSVCRGVGSVKKGDWDEGVQALA